MKLIIKENSIVINQHSDNGRGSWDNPFGDFIPSVGDIIYLGEHNSKWDKEYVPMRQYKVIGRSFSAVENFNHLYTDPVCILNVVGYPNACFFESDYR